MFYDYLYKYRIKFNLFSGRKRYCVIDNLSYIIEWIEFYFIFIWVIIKYYYL